MPSRESWQRSGGPDDVECRPRFITPRNPARKTIGHELINTARLLERTPLPWQDEVFQGAFEVDEHGLLWYREVVVVVPRQSGKTTLVVPWGVHRSIMWPERQHIIYTAQSRIKAREKWMDDQVYLIKRSHFAQFIKPNRFGMHEPNLAHGEEHIPWVNDSKWGIDAPTETAGHGATLDLGFIDEAFSQQDARVEQAMSPAMITRPDSQKVITSTAGSSKRRSPFLWRKIEMGRNRVSAGLDSRTFYVEYSAEPDADWLDPRVWWATMPALGYTQAEEKVAAEADSLGEDEFRRAYLCQWGDDMGGDSRIPWDAWMDCLDSRSQMSSTLTWVIDVSPERSWSAISVAAQREDGRIHIETVEKREGTGWVAERMAQLVSAHGGSVYYDHVTTGALAPDLRDHGVDAEPIAAQDVKVSAPALYDAVMNDRVVHIGQDELDDALRGAATRKFGDGWAWARGPSMDDITALVSATLAFWMLAKRLPDLNYDPLSGIG